MGLYSWDIVGFRYGNQWRRGRRLFHEFLNMKAVVNFDGYQHKHAYQFLSRLAETPDELLDHAQLCVSPRAESSWYLGKTNSPSSLTGALIMDITYGLDIKSHENKFLQAAQCAMEHAQRAMVPGAFLVDAFPIRSSGPKLPGLCNLLTISP